MKNAIVLVLSLFALGAKAQSPVPVAGKDYVEIPNGRPLEPVQGAVVVEEFFNYICPACNMFEPTFVQWAAQLPEYAKLHHVPASFRQDFVQYARAYYAAETLGIAEKSHQAVYDAIHRQHVIPAEGDRPDEEKIANWYAAQYGVDAQQFLATMRSFGVDAKVRRASEQMTRNKIPSTPSVVVNGRYLVRGTTYADSLRIASYLIEKEHGS
jgi:thiol:disulfide interchange protein DsbA